MSSARTRTSSAPSAGADRWTLAFAIVMLLLFALFLVLYSVSKKEAVKLREDIETLKAEKAKPAPARESSPLESSSSQREAAAANVGLQEAILNEAKAFLAVDAAGSKTKTNSDVEVLDLASGDFLVRIAAPNLFQAGDARVSKETRSFVDRLGELIVKSGRRLRIEGHADFDDSEAIGRKASEYPNTWELSAARSSALAQYWMRKFDLNPLKIESAGFGKYRPLEKKTGRSSQANRRIEVVILRAE